MHVGQGGTKVHLLHEDLGDQIRAPDHRSTDDVAVPAQVFGGGMDDQVNPVVQRIAPPGLAKVLSITVSRLWRFATATMAGMSQTLSTGLVRVSM